MLWEHKSVGTYFPTAEKDEALIKMSDFNVWAGWTQSVYQNHCIATGKCTTKCKCEWIYKYRCDTVVKKLGEKHLRKSFFFFIWDLSHFLLHSWGVFIAVKAFHKWKFATLHVKVWILRCGALLALAMSVCVLFGLDVDMHESNFKRLRYQIQTWAALPGLTNEELLCGERRNLQHLPFIYTGGPVFMCECIWVWGGKEIVTLNYILGVQKQETRCNFGVHNSGTHDELTVQRLGFRAGVRNTVDLG